MDGTKEIASVKAHVLQVPTKKLPLEALHATEQNPIPAKQLAINYLCQKNAEVETLCEREKTDSVAMVLPITTHLYIESLVVDTPHRKLGVATAMLDVLISMAAPETVSMFAGHEQAEVMAMSASALLSTVVRTRMRLSSLSAPRRSSSATPCVPSLPRVPAFWFPVVSSPATTRRMVRKSSMTI